MLIVLLQNMVLTLFTIIATSDFLTALECTKFVFGRGYALFPLGELTALPQTPSWFKGATSKEYGGRGENGGGEEKGGRFSPSQIPGFAPGSCFTKRPLAYTCSSL